MNVQTLQAQVDAARAYETLFVPALFGQWAPKVADAAQIQTGQRVLDVACGTGILARSVHSRTGRSGYVAGLDPSPGMLAVANDLAPAVDWCLGSAESIPFLDQSFDRVVSQFGLMFFADHQQGLREMLRVLTCGGRLVVAVWDSLVNMPAYCAEVALLERLAGPQAANALRAPFILGDPENLSAMFRDAGAVSVATTTHQGTARFPSIPAMVEADLRGWLPAMGVMLSEEQIGRMLDESQDVLGEYAGPDGQVAFVLGAHLVVAEKS